MDNGHHAVVHKSNEGEFCPFCGAILPLPMAPCEIACRVCATNVNIKKKINKLVCKTVKIYERTVADTENADMSGGDTVVDHLCSRCGHDKATFSTMQTRSADEGQTVFYTCLSCKKKDIEYS